MILYAVNIHVGGGKVLLDEILANSHSGDISHIFIDERYPIPANISPNIKIFKIKPKFFARLLAEFKLRSVSKASPGEEIRSFTNMPPIFRLRGKTILFLQNALLLPGQLTYCKSSKHKIRTFIECMVLRSFHKNLDEVDVQTNWMKESLQLFFNKKINVKPIYPQLPELTQNIEKKFDFITVTSSVSYKNLDFLLKTWLHTPTLKDKRLLVVTDSLSKNQADFFQKLIHSNFQITVFQSVSRQEIYKLYEESKTLIVTSSIESYGLPLYEASHFKLRIIAPKLPYVQDSSLEYTPYNHLNEKSLQEVLINS